MGAGCEVDPEPPLALAPLVAPLEVAPTELELVLTLPLAPTDLPLDPVPVEAVELAALGEEHPVVGDLARERVPEGVGHGRRRR